MELKIYFSIWFIQPFNFVLYKHKILTKTCKKWHYWYNLTKFVQKKKIQATGCSLVCLIDTKSVICMSRSTVSSCTPHFYIQLSFNNTNLDEPVNDSFASFIDKITDGKESRRERKIQRSTLFFFVWSTSNRFGVSVFWNYLFDVKPFIVDCIFLMFKQISYTFIRWPIGFCSQCEDEQSLAVRCCRFHGWN